MGGLWWTAYLLLESLGKDGQVGVGVGGFLCTLVLLLSCRTCYVKKIIIVGLHFMPCYPLTRIHGCVRRHGMLTGCCMPWTAAA